MVRKSFLPALLIAAAFNCSCFNTKALRVGSKNFTEQLILGELIAQLIEHRLPDLQVQRRLNLGGTLIAQQALTGGGIHLYPEYTGTALTAVLKKEPVADPGLVFSAVSEEYQRLGLKWLPPLGFNNTFAMVIRGEEARKRGLRTLSAALALPDVWALGVGYEFQGRPDGLAALDRIYHPSWRTAPKTMDLGLLLPALEQGSVTMIAANQTDGNLGAADVTVLEDDRHAFPPYEAAIVVRQDALEEYPGLEAVLQSLSGRISEEAMRRMNLEVEGKKRPPRIVVAEWLKASGLL